MTDIRFYLTVLARRLHWFFLVVVLFTTAAVIYALGRPPIYVSQMRLMVEAPQIPENLAASTASTPAPEQLEILEERLLTRDNLLKIARDYDVLPEADRMRDDSIVKAMRASTKVRTESGRDKATLMTVSFEAGTPQTAAAVLNAYLDIIQASDAEIRQSRAVGTLDFFRAEVDRLRKEVDRQSARILAFKQANRDALPDSQDFRMSQRSDLQQQSMDIQREIKRMEGQRDRLIQLFQATGLASGDNRGSDGLTPDEERLRDLQSQLSTLLVTLSEENPKVKLLRARIDRLKQAMADEEAQRGADVGDDNGDTGETAAPKTQAEATLDVQLSEIDSEVAILKGQLQDLDKQIKTVTDAIDHTPEVSITLDEMERQQTVLGDQYKAAEARLAQATTGNLIETDARGQRVSVIETPNVPDFPAKPSRTKIALAGGLLGVVAGLSLIVVMEMMNTALRRPEDLVTHLDITPFGTIPYMRSRWETLVQRGLRVALVLVVLAGIPAAIYAIDVYYYPLDLMAAQIKDKLEGMGSQIAPDTADTPAAQGQ